MSIGQISDNNIVCIYNFLKKKLQFNNPFYIVFLFSFWQVYIVFCIFSTLTPHTNKLYFNDIELGPVSNINWIFCNTIKVKLITTNTNIWSLLSKNK